MTFPAAGPAAGSRAPDFETRNQYGEPVRLSDYSGRRDVVLLWFREDDGDLVDAFFDILTDLKAGGVVWLLTP